LDESRGNKAPASTCHSLHAARAVPEWSATRPVRRRTCCDAIYACEEPEKPPALLAEVKTLRLGVHPYCEAFPLEAVRIRMRDFESCCSAAPAKQVCAWLSSSSAPPLSVHLPHPSTAFRGDAWRASAAAADTRRAARWAISLSPVAGPAHPLAARRCSRRRRRPPPSPPPPSPRMPAPLRQRSSQAFIHSFFINSSFLVLNH
jgi:hypothetical protein